MPRRNSRSSLSKRLFFSAFHNLVLAIGSLTVAALPEVTLANPTSVAQRPDLPAQKPALTTQQQIIEEGNALFSKGKQLLDQNTPESLQEAIKVLERARQLFSKAQDPGNEGNSLHLLGYTSIRLRKPQEAIDYFKQALALFRDKGVRTRSEEASRVGEAVTLSNIGGVYDGLGEEKQAFEYYYQALIIFRDKTISSVLPPQESRRNEAKILITIGLVSSNLGEKQQALKYYSQALEIYQDKHFREVFSKESSKGEAVTLNSIGGVYDDLGEGQQALGYYKQVFPLFGILGDRRTEATTYNNIGSTYSDLGEKQLALKYYNQALEIYRDKDFRKAFPQESSKGEAATLSNTGRVYDDLGEKQWALDNYNRSLLLSQAISDNDLTSTIFNNIGRVYADLGEIQQALKYYHQALGLNQTVNISSKAVNLKNATVLNNIGLAYADLGKMQQALEYYNRVLPLRRAVEDRRGEAITFNSIGSIYEKLGKKEKALEYYYQALRLFQAVKDYRGKAVILNNSAYIYRDQGNLIKALNQINAAITIIEDLRTKIGNGDLRASYFATVQNYYQFKIDLLMQLHQQQPQKGYDIKALETSDRARARSLIELLTESRADIYKGVSRELVDREKNLQQQLDVKDKRLAQLSSEKETQPQIVKIQQEIKGIYQQQEQLKGDIRANSPAYANLKYPEPLTFSQMQQQLDDNTLLLQYSLGEERSYLWAVTKTGQIRSYPLPGRKEIEEAATNFYSALSAPQCDPQMPADCDPTFATDKGKALYQIILAQVIDQLPEKKRLLIVADGALQYIPFAALPMPDSQTYVPLVTKYEIVHAPSVSALVALRAQFGIRSPAPKLLAAIADPVFSLDRVSDRQPSSSIAPGRTEALVSNTPNKSAESFRLELDRSLAARSLSDCGLNFQSLQPLPDTRTTAETILASIADPQRTIHRYGFDANLDWVTNTEQSHLNQYQMLLFATHGCANSVRPELSGIVLSLVNEKGQPQRGFLRLGDIFNLDLSADLVVLSACQTGLGKDIRGEGLVGLTRGFMYAGAKRVVTSLWNIDAQQPTADLLTTFFNGMRPTGRETPLPPAAALQTAQIAMWKKYRDPYYWAAFTLQGEWR